MLIPAGHDVCLYKRDACRREWALSEQRGREEGLAQMREGMAALNAIGTAITHHISLPYWRKRTGRAAQALLLNEKRKDNVDE